MLLPVRNGAGRLSSGTASAGFVSAGIRTSVGLPLPVGRRALLYGRRLFSVGTRGLHLSVGTRRGCRLMYLRTTGVCPEPTCEPGVGEREPLCGPRDEVRDGVPDEPHDEQGPAYTPHRWDRAGAEDIRPEGKDNRRQQAMHAYHTSDDASEQLRHADGRAFTRASRRKHLPRCRTCRSRQTQPCRNHPSLRGNGRRSAAARAKTGTAPNLHPPNGAIFRRFPANPPNGFSSSSRDDSPAAEVCVRGAGRISAPHRDEEAEQRIRPEQNLCREAQQHRNES